MTNEGFVVNTCPITGDAEVEVRYPLDATGSWIDHLRWLRADPEIHVAVEVLNDMDSEGLKVLTAKYELGETCPDNPRAIHARLKEAGQ